jgi:putative transcriptional regulator
MASLAGSFLVARPSLRDPNFARTVVLILAHNDEGAYGVVVNRPAQVTVSGLSFPVLAGGPCPSPGLILLHGHPEWADQTPDELGEDSTPRGEAAPGIFIADTHSWKQVCDASPGQPMRVRLVRGYAGWGPGQLEGELAAGAWALTPAEGQLLFDMPAEELWDRLAPPKIPQPSVN